MKEQPYLVPCPVCGRRPKVNKNALYHDVMCICDDRKGASIIAHCVKTGHCKTEAAAIAEWNNKLIKSKHNK